MAVDARVELAAEAVPGVLEHFQVLSGDIDHAKLDSGQIAGLTTDTPRFQEFRDRVKQLEAPPKRQ